MWLLVAFACRPPVDTGGPEDTDTDPAVTRAAFPEPLPSCEALTAPYPLGTVADVAAAWAGRPEVGPLNEAMAVVREAAIATGCPTRVQENCDNETFTGGCDAGGVTASGTATFTACDDGGSIAWTDFEVASTDPVWSLAVDGSLDASASGDVHEVYAITATLHGVCAPERCDGTFAWSGVRDTHGFGRLRHQRVTLLPELGGRAGDFCLDEDVDHVEDCATEGVGWTVLHGDHVAGVLWDGDVACDGCGAVFVDGLPTGTWCP